MHCIMLADMSKEFSHRFETAQPKDMLQVLEDTFGTSDDTERHKTSCAIFNAKIRDGASVTDHVLYMIVWMERLSKIDFSLHDHLGKVQY